MIWMIEKLRTRLYLREFQYDLDVPIHIETEYQLEGDKVFSSSLSRKIRYNRPLLLKEARSRSVAELDRMVFRKSSGSLNVTLSPGDMPLKNKAME